MNLDLDRVKAMTEVPDHRIWNVYLYGSRVYGTCTESSDYDFLVIASSLDAHKEWNDGEYNVHIKSPDLFKDKLWSHSMSALECIYGPSWAKLQEKKDWDFELNEDKLKITALTESFRAWGRGKYLLLEGDIYRAQKSLWHSIRILYFANQILLNGSIAHFGEANSLLKQIINLESVKWREYKDLLLPIKSALMSDLQG